MSETIDYAEMLEIPVSTLNVTKKRGKKRRAPEELKEQAVEAVNERLEAPAEERAEEERVAEGENVVDYGVPEGYPEKPRRRFLEGKVLIAEFIAVCALCATILLTNLFWENSAINTFFRGLIEEDTPAAAVDDRTYSELELGSVVSDANVAGLAELPFQLAELGPDRIILQQLMYLSQAEIQAYRDFSRRTFGCDYPELEAWHREEDAGYLARLKEELAKIRKTDYPVPVEFTGHVYPRLNDEAPPCEAPFCRVHIRHDGAVGFCTDYFGFSAGNITERPLEEIFRGERAELFRAAVRENALPTCRHCPWRLQHGFRMLP